MSEVIDFPGTTPRDIAQHVARATRYRIKASLIARMVENQPDDENTRSQISLALSWIQLAENEEWLGVVHRG